jgi:hypothetical protein
MDGTILGADLDRIRIGRVAGNHLELHGDRSVSGDHAVLSRTDAPGVWRLEDPRSTNGTWVDDADVRQVGAQTLPADACFMVGHTVIRCSPGITDSFALPADRLRSEAERLVMLFSREVSEGYGAAIALAAAERRPFLTDRHFFLGLATTNPALPLFDRGKGPVPARFLGDTLRRNEYWTGARAWIDRRLRASAIDTVVLFEDDVTFTPRLLRLLLDAEEQARAEGEATICPVHVLRTFFTGPANRPRDLLVQQGIDPASLLGTLDTAPPVGLPAETRSLDRRSAGPAGSAAFPAPAVPAAMAAAAAAVSPVPTSGDPFLDARARETARRLYGTASLYHLADVEDRHLALRQLLVQEVSQIPAEGRPRLLGQLQRLFPVPSAGSAESLERTRSGQERTDRQHDDRRPAEVKESRPEPVAAAIPWATVLAGKHDADLSEVPAADRQILELLTDVVSFANDLERFILSVVQGLRSPGLGTQSFQLPGYSTSIRRFARDLQAGKNPSRESLQDYLGAIRTWLVVAVGAYTKAPELWFEEFWRKASPSAIERATDQKGGFLKIDALTFWNRYKERVRNQSPDLVSDEIQQIARREAEEKFHQLFDKRRKS